MIWFWVAVGEILSGFVRDDDGIGFYECGEVRTGLLLWVLDLLFGFGLSIAM
jgi:hypothetical protein